MTFWTFVAQNPRSRQLTLQISLHGPPTLEVPHPYQPIPVLLKRRFPPFPARQRQPGSAHRWDIMSEQAAGSQARRMRPLLPAPASRPPPKPTGPRPRPANVTVACRPCREKKAKVLDISLQVNPRPVCLTESAGSALARGRHVADVCCGTLTANTHSNRGRCPRKPSGGVTGICNTDQKLMRN